MSDDFVGCPEELCQQSEHSPGVVENEEDIARIVIAPEHIDAVERGEIYVTRIDTVLRHDFSNELPSYAAVFRANGKATAIDPVFSEMHDESKRLLASFITNEMAERIDLNA